MLIDKIKGQNPITDQIKDFKRIIHVDSVYLFGVTVQLKQKVTDYMNKTFYNMTALKLKDWKTYEEMGSLAYHLYGIKLTDNYLPPQKLEQGIDILYILRHLQEFVGNYYYSLHTQVFFEATHEDSKHINIIGIPQVSNSLHTHGIGIINTLVNVIYKFLITKLRNISNFLFDEYIYAPLFKERNFFRENRDKLNSKYPFDRAENLAKIIKRIGKLEDGFTFLEKFQQLITQIGNALGFVRIMKCAYLRYCNDVQKYLVEGGHDISYGAMAKDANQKGII